jgi:tetratricopeptide (TPR) repeat protein
LAKKHGNASIDSVDLEARATKAYQEGRSQHALDLAKQAYKQDPTGSRKQLLRRCYLLRAKQMRLQGHFKDAAALLQFAMPLGDDDAAWLQSVAEELAAAGNLGGAQELLARLPAGPATALALAAAADAAILQGPAGRAQLTEKLQETYDLVVGAFAHLESGQDERARAALQGIGLQSPFLEWKLLLRGLLAYYHKDDARALENWQRLEPGRVPARMIAPLRFRIDPAFGQQQSHSAQTILHQLGNRLIGRDLTSSLKEVQANVGSLETLPKAFHQAAQVLPALRQLGPDLVPRLATCFYGAILTHGEADDMQRFRQTFGPPADDPQFDRLEALVNEKIGDLTQAHQHWNNYQRWLESAARTGNAPAWCGPDPKHVDHARALIWTRMGENAARLPDKMPPMFAFLQGHPAFPKKLSPGPEQCFAKALELVPQLLEAHVALFEWLVDNDQAVRAVQVGRELLQRHPDHAPTLEALGDLHNRRQEYDEALSVYARAFQLNPLERTLRDKMRMAHVAKARAFAEAGDMERARAEFQAALTFGDQSSLTVVYCKWAAAELRAGETASAEEYLQRALAQCQHPLPIAYYMVTEMARHKFKGPIKTRFDKDFKAALAAPPNPAAIAAALSMDHALRDAGIAYHGQQAHEKKLLAYLKSTPPTEFSEQLLVDVARSLAGLKAARPLQTLTMFGRRSFPSNPWFPFVEAEGYLSLGPDRCPVAAARALLEKAEPLAHALPPSSAKQELLDLIENRKQMLAVLSPDFMGMLARELGNPFGGFDEEEGAGAWHPEEWVDDGGGFFMPPPVRPRRKKQRKGR